MRKQKVSIGQCQGNYRGRTAEDLAVEMSAPGYLMEMLRPADPANNFPARGILSSVFQERLGVLKGFPIYIYIYISPLF